MLTFLTLKHLLVNILCWHKKVEEEWGGETVFIYHLLSD